MNLCVVGTGAISKSMLAEFARSDVLKVTAICSRKESSGRAMADQFGIDTVYTDYAAMLAQPSVEAVYIGLPNTLHYGYTKQALLAGKHVLCEKPFAPTVAEAEELIALAKEKGLFLFETITTAHHPNYRVVRDNLPKLGRIRLVNAVFCQFSSRYPALLEGKVSPVLDPAYKGGALMDINLYNIHFVVGLFGMPAGIHYRGNIHTNGVDTSGILSLEYPDFLCQCVGAKDCAAANSVQILGEAGYMEITPCASNLLEVKLCLRGREAELFSLRENPWYYEVQDIGRIIGENGYDECYRFLETTRDVAAVLEAARADGKLGF